MSDWWTVMQVITKEYKVTNNQLINGRYFAVQNCRFRIHFIINLTSIYRITGAAKVPREASQQSDRACAGEQGP